MEFVYNSNTILKVHRLNENDLYSECTILSNDLEIIGWIVADIHSLVIKRAAWEVYRSTEENTGQYLLPELEGITAYLHSGHDLKRLLGEKERELVRELMADCIRGIVQSESYFLKERGYNSYSSFMNYWAEMYANSCRRFSNLPRREASATEKSHDELRSSILFNRIKTVNIVNEENGDYTINSTFSDSHHQLSTRIAVNNNGIVTAADGGYVRAPEKICFENSHHLSKLVGTRLSEMSKKEIAALAGGSAGCDHLVSLLYKTSMVLGKVLRKRQN